MASFTDAPTSSCDCCMRISLPNQAYPNGEERVLLPIESAENGKNLGCILALDRLKAEHGKHHFFRYPGSVCNEIGTKTVLMPEVHEKGSRVSGGNVTHGFAFSNSPSLVITSCMVAGSATRLSASTWPKMRSMRLVIISCCAVPCANP